MPANEEQYRRAHQWAARRLRRARGPKSTRLYQYDVEAHDAIDEAQQIRSGGNR